jgi:hypothetical protein
MGMNLKESDLLPTETVLVRKFANLWVKPSEHGLSEFVFNQYLGNNEAIGGKAFLTNYRIVFKSHGFNRLTGMHSLFLPNIREIKKGIFGITVETAAQEYGFVMWFNGRFVRTARERQEEFGPKEVKKLRDLLRQHPEKAGEGLKKNRALEVINKILAGGMKVPDWVEKLSQPEQSTFAELLTLFSDRDKD